MTLPEGLSPKRHLTSPKKIQPEEKHKQSCLVLVEESPGPCSVWHNYGVWPKGTQLDEMMLLQQFVEKLQETEVNLSMR
ncbi:hypothetical protein Y1Q_0002173 [Alligator mississippiensis]|uniref:Uncharacterized protein n=1 Tax=Alligator mississippiensis TaxID=8496 RepID=A0A151MPU1_ALLMI|nr:hypothetical protein Y1Q_0002173 [Alligator mississippiensis]